MSAFVNTPFNYTGSKFRLLPQLAPLFDHSKRQFVDLFCGGGSVYTHALGMKGPDGRFVYDSVLANDIIFDLVLLQQRLIDEGQPFADRVRGLCVAKDDQAGYHALRDLYNAARTPERLYALMLCCTNNMMRFNRSFGFNQTFGRRTFNPQTQAKINAWLAAVGPLAGRLSFSSESFESVVTEPGGAFWYCDPPYGGTEAGYNAYWSEESEDRLHDQLIQIVKGGDSFALSGVVGEHRPGGGRCRLVDRLLRAGFRHAILNHDYDKVARVGGAESREVLIMGGYP